VSEWVTLSLRASLSAPIEVEGLTADSCARLSTLGIQKLRAWQGNQTASVGDFFDVRGEHAPRVRVEGALGTVEGLATGNASGEVHIEGSAGSRVAAGMSGGHVVVHGDVGHDAGTSMAGGVLHVMGKAGDRLGAALPGAAKGMMGGEIVVAGSAGSNAAACLRRGLVVVGGDIATDAGRAMIAGTLVVLGSVSGVPGRGNKRGSIVVLGRVTIPDTYAYACTFEPGYVRLLATYLIRRYGVPIPSQALSARFRRFCGDAGTPGKGEILVCAPETRDGT